MPLADLKLGGFEPFLVMASVDLKCGVYDSYPLFGSSCRRKVSRTMATVFKLGLVLCFVHRSTRLGGKVWNKA